MILSIIIPYYNAKVYTDELLNELSGQITKDVEVILVDDGSDEPYTTDLEWVKVIRQKNGGASKARNTGLDNAAGDYIAFIDADDMVSERYIERILDKIETEHFDYCYLSWRTIGNGWRCEVKLNTIDDKFPSFNLCVWNRIYKRELIGDTRFNEHKKIAEDAEFIRDIERGKKSFIPEYMYYYRSDVPNSLTKRFREGKLETQRVVYYYPTITKDMDLLEEVKATDRYAEVIIMTARNDQPDLERYAMVLPPCKMYGTELRGQHTSLFTKINVPITTQVCIYTRETFQIGGIETFIYNFCVNLSKYYNILVLYDRMADSQRDRLKGYARTLKNDINQKIICDTLIINRITDKPTINIQYRQKVQMCHMPKLDPRYVLPKDNDIQVPVSEVVARSFASDLRNYEVINNLTAPQKVKEPLMLVSAQRLNTAEKGKSRIEKLAKLLRDKHIPFIWLLFSDGSLICDGVVNLKPTLDIAPYIKKANYLVQLSDAEGFCYSIVEALELGTAVITTPIEVLDEIGFKDKENGYIIPFDIVDDDIERIYNVPTFTYKYNNAKRVKQWRRLLDRKPKHLKDRPKALVKVTQAYKDMALYQTLTPGMVVEMPIDRANEIQNMGFGEII